MGNATDIYIMGGRSFKQWTDRQQVNSQSAMTDEQLKEWRKVDALSKLGCNCPECAPPPKHI